MLNSNHFKLTCLLLFLVPTLNSCTQKQENVTGITLSIPETRTRVLGEQGLLAAPTNLYLNHLVINVTAPDISSPILVTWDKGDNCSGSACAVPAEFPLSVPRGANRLIQVLAVYGEGGDSDGGYLYYGDATKSLLAAVEPVTIIIDPLQTSAVQANGKISGRYLTGSGDNGPTGPLAIQFKPAGKPEMLIEKSFIFSGWFSVFALKDTPLRYVLPDGTDMFGASVSIDSSAFLRSDILKIQSPNTLQFGDSKVRLGETLILGFFGPGASSKTACLTSGNYTFANVKKSPSNAALVYPSDFVISGAQSSCLSGTLYEDFITYLPTAHEMQGFEHSLGVQGPFVSQADGRFLATSGSTLSWQYLPNLDAASLSGVKIFARSTLASGENDDYRNDGEIDCGKLPGLGFTQVGSIDYPGTSFNLSNLPLLASPTLIACPHKDNKFYPVAIETQIGNGGGVPTQLGIEKSFQPLHGLLENSCVGYRVQLLNANSVLTGMTLPLSISVQQNSANLPTYSNSTDCYSNTNASTGSFTIPSMSSEAEFFVKIPLQSNASSLNVTVFRTAIPAMPLRSLTLPIKTYSQKTLAFERPSHFLVGLCYPVRLRYLNYDGTSAALPSDTTVNLVPANGMEFHSNATCTSSAATATLLSSTGEATLFAKVISSSSNPSFTTSFVSGTNHDSLTLSVRTGSGTSAPSSLRLSGPMNLNRDSCMGPFEAEPVNANGTPVLLSSSGTWNLSSAGAALTYFQNADCSTNLNPSYTAGTYKLKFYAMPIAAGPGQLTISAGASVNASMNYMVQGLYQFFLQVNDPLPLVSGSCAEHEVTLRNFNGTSASASAPITAFVSPTGFPGSEIYSSRVNGVCQNVLSNLAFPSGSNSQKFYTRIFNTQSSTQYFTTQVTANFMSGGVINVAVAGASPLAPAETALQKISAEYTFDLIKSILPFSGVPTFTFTKDSGSGTLTSSVYNSADGDSAAFTVTDSASTPASFSVTTQTVAKTATLDFTSSLPTGATISRPSVGRYISNTGLLTTASSGAARFDHNSDPATSYAPMGLLIEGPATNLILDSENFTAGPWTHGGTLSSITSGGINSPAGSTAGVYLLTDNNPEPYNVGRVFNTFTPDMTNNSDYVASVFIKKESSSYAGLMMIENGVMASGVNVDLDNGVASKMEGPNTPQTLYGYGIQKFANGWYRIWVKYKSSPSCVNGGSGPCQGSIAIFPAHSSNNSPGGEIAATGGVYVFGAQVEIGTVPTSYIPTSGAPASRSADIVTIPIISTNFAGMAFGAAGTFRAETTLFPGAIVGAGTLFELCGSNCAQESMKIGLNSSGIMSFQTTQNGLLQMPVATFQYPNLQGGNKLGWSWATNSNAKGSILSLNGSSVHSGSTLINAPNFTSGHMYIGNDSVGNSPLPMHIRKLEYWPHKLSAPAMDSW